MSDNGSQPERRDGVDLAEPLLTAQRISELLGIPRSSVYDYARRKDNPLPCLAIGRHRRFFRSAVERWLDDQRPK
jgi:excisionase family DNA binding protein